METSRILTVDIAKAFAIILVIAGHCIQYLSGLDYFLSESFYSNFAFKLIYSFHMPLFMLISGYLFAKSIRKRAFFQTIKTKFRSLIIPVIFWTMTPIIVRNVVALVKGTQTSTLIDFIKYSICSCIDSYWFLWAVFLLTIVVLLVNRFFKDSIFVYLILFVISFLIPDVRNLALYKFMFPYFVIGYLISSHQELLKNLINDNRWLGALSLLFVVLFCFYDKQSFIYVSGHCIISEGSFDFNQLVIDIYRYLIGFVGAVVVIILSQRAGRVCKPLLIDVVTCLSKNTEGLYIISLFIMTNCFYRLNIQRPSFWLYLLEVIMVTVLSLLIISLIKKSSIMNRLLLGGR